MPHTWNGIDGQDGGNDYYRGTCYYKKILNKSELPENKLVYMELEGANSSAALFVNGKKAAHHDGGYSTWRANITSYLTKEENEILVAVDNSSTDNVYPQKADFTFYGGIYRNVNLIFVDEAHFDLDFFGSCGVKVTPTIVGKDAKIIVDVFLSGVDGSEQVEYKIYDGAATGESICTATIDSATNVSNVFHIKNVHLWHGRKDPHLYTLEVKLLRLPIPKIGFAP